MTTHIGIIGYAGRMGQAIARATLAHPEANLMGGIERSGIPVLGMSEGKLIVTDSAGDLFPHCDVVVDFSAESVMPEHARMAAAQGKAFMTGITGLGDEAKAALAEAAKTIPVLYASNTSLSLAVMKQLVKMASYLLRDQDYDIAIHDEHHRMKKDAPSGTALTLGECVTAGNGGSKAPAYSAIRAGFIVGEHDVKFVGQGETITLHHSVTDRDVFARGTVQAAVWLHGKPPGLYGMDDVLGIN
jgi:4-hydroxy-tetrahydrodipicolinate reductase